MAEVYRDFTPIANHIKDIERSVFIYDTPNKCITCGEEFVWEEGIDQTNGDDLSGGTKLKVNTPAEFETCKCCGHEEKTKEVTYLIPKK